MNATALDPVFLRSVVRDIRRLATDLAPNRNPAPMPLPRWRRDAVPVSPLMFDGADYERAMRAAVLGARAGRMVGTTPHAAAIYPGDRMPRHRSVETVDPDPPVQLAPRSEQDDEVAHDAVASAWAWAQGKGLAWCPLTVVRRIAQRRGARHVVHAQRMRDGLTDVATADPADDPVTVGAVAGLDAAPLAALESILTPAQRERAAAALARWRAAPAGTAGRNERRTALRALRRISGTVEASRG